MTKGKKQHAQVISFLSGPSSRVELEDSEFLVCGAALETGAVDERGRDLVLIAPRSTEVPRLKMRQTPLGALAPTLLGTMGLEEIVWDAVLLKSRPRCESCAILAERSEGIDPALWPSQGYVALVVDGIDESISLREQCELSGFDRAVVAGRLIRAEDLRDEVGEPVIQLFSISQRSEAERALGEWFNRGGVAIRLVHFFARDGEARNVQKIFRSWRCPACSRSFNALTIQALEESEACRRCRGEGWLLVDDNRLVACEDCDGFARITPLSRYEFIDRPLSAVASLPLSHVVREVEDVIPLADARRLRTLCDSGLGGYPIGSPDALLSHGERVVATLASLRLSKPQSLVAVVGGAGEESEHIRDSVSALGAGLSRMVTSRSWTPEQIAVSPKSEEVFTVRDIKRGPLSVESFSFARGALTVVQGEPGSGKTLLLAEILKRFAKRKKLAHLGSFGSLKRCYTIEPSRTAAGIVLDLLELGSDFATEVAKTRGAKERGVVKEDLLTASSQNLCSECSGGGVGERCSVCDGGVYDSRVGGLSFGGMSVLEIMRRPLADVSRVFSLNDRVMVALSKIPEEVRSHISLGTPLRSLEPALRAFLATISGIARCLEPGVGGRDSLLLIDAPFETTTSFQKLILDSMLEYVAAGGTIVCAAVPKPLEKVASSVIRLHLSENEQVGLVDGRFFDLRMSRRVSVRTER